MKKSIIRFASLVLAGIVLLAGCQKEGANSKSGKAVKFTAGLKSVATKTAYSGNVSGNFERINWVNGESILLWSDKATDRNATTQKFDIYKIATVSASGAKSVATLTIDAGNGLVWSEEGTTYKFWGVSPSVSGTPEDGKMSFSIPVSQAMPADASAQTTENATTLPADMSNAWLLAAVEGIEANVEAVNLDFYPAFTAFELTLTADSDYDGDITVKKVELISETGLAGNVAATLVTGTRTNTVGTDSHTIGASTYVCTPATGNLTYTLPADTKVNKTSSVTFTVFALPQNATGLKLKIDVNVDGEDASFTGTLSKGGQPITFGACEKHRLKGIAVPGNLWKIFYAPGIIEADQWEEVDGGSMIVE